MHQPRHLHESARLFGPNILEVCTEFPIATSTNALHQMCTRTEWYVVPLFWGPITAYLFLRSLFQFTGPLPNFFQNPALPLSYLPNVPLESWARVLPCFFLGNLIWTLLEYLLHRFLFHVDEILPDRPIFLMLHFLLHGIHHYLPMDR